MAVRALVVVRLRVTKDLRNRDLAMPSKRKRRPKLVQFGALTPEHFTKWPVWMSVHIADYDEPWYDDTDEETFRPFDGKLPANPNKWTLLVRAEMTLADGSVFPGFVTPPGAPGRRRDTATIQPHLFGPDGKPHGFWTGVIRSTSAYRSRFYALLGRRPHAVFPIRFHASPELVREGVKGRIEGFKSYKNGKLWAAVVLDQ
jgi:hypothetical protein